MTSEASKTPPKQEQFIRFIDTVKKAGQDPAFDELGEALNKLVPPVRAGETEGDEKEASCSPSEG